MNLSTNRCYLLLLSFGGQRWEGGSKVNSLSATRAFRSWSVFLLLFQLSSGNQVELSLLTPQIIESLAEPKLKKKKNKWKRAKLKGKLINFNPPKSRKSGRAALKLANDRCCIDLIISQYFWNLLEKHGTVFNASPYWKGGLPWDGQIFKIFNTWKNNW